MRALLGYLCVDKSRETFTSGEHHSPDAFTCASAKLKAEGTIAERECVNMVVV